MKDPEKVVKIQAPVQRCAPAGALQAAGAKRWFPDTERKRWFISVEAIIKGFARGACRTLRPRVSQRLEFFSPWDQTF